MEMRRGRVTGMADPTHEVALAHELPFPHHHAPERQVGQQHGPRPALDDHVVPGELGGALGPEGDSEDHESRQLAQGMQPAALRYALDLSLIHI